MPSPRSCFGLDQTPHNPLCPTCPYQQDCQIAMGARFQRIPVSQARPNFIPSRLVEKTKGLKVYEKDQDTDDLDGLYQFCHEAVFQRSPSGHLSHKVKPLILENIAEAGTSARLFFLANMLGWAISHELEKFPAQALTGEAALRRVQTYAQAAHRRFGTFDVTTLDLLLGTGVASEGLEERLLNSEIIAGSWIVGYKVTHAGLPFTALYQEKEIELDPFWLAIEKTYYDDVLEDHIHGPFGSAEQNKHRSHVSQALLKLKRRPRLAMLAFKARERIFGTAVLRVLQARGFCGEDFEMKDAPVVLPLHFWSRLGLAVQQFECLKFVDKLPSEIGKFAQAEAARSTD